MTTMTVKGHTLTIEDGTWRGPKAIVEDAKRMSKIPMPDEGLYVPDYDRLAALRAAYWIGGTVAEPEPKKRTAQTDLVY
jgi:hypothetical protein